MGQRLLLYLLAWVCLVLEINAIEPNKPFIAVQCSITGEEEPEKIFISQLDQEPLDFSTTIPTDHSINGLSYDPVDEKLYVSQRGETYHIDLDGSNKVTILEESSAKLSITQSRKIVTSGLSGTKMFDIDGNSDPTTISAFVLNDIEVVGSRTMGATFPTTIVSFDTDGSQLLEETYELPSTPISLDVDVEAGILYYLELESSPIVLYRLRVNDYNSTCVEKILDSTDLHGGVKLSAENNYAPTLIAHYKDDVYVTGRAIEGQHSGLGRINKDTGNLTDAGANVLPESVSKCKQIYIYDPAQAAAEENFAGATGIPLPDDNGESNLTMTGNTSIPIPLHIKEPYFGGMIAEMVIPITSSIKDWRLEISFPRQVFKLEIEGCSAEVLSKTRREYGRRKGTDYVIVPTAESRSPPPGQDLMITIIAKTFKKVRNMKRGISVVFIPTPNILIDLRCDNM